MALIDPAGPRLLDRHTAGRQPGPTVEPPPPTARPIGSASPWAAARYAAPPISVYSRQWRGSDWARRCLPGPAPEPSSEPLRRRDQPKTEIGALAHTPRWTLL